ncbi:MAG: membrane-bound O-acyltransferase family protein [Planctomycetes bacterium]|nr:membrane-bound O-acyltransferase family protein [Planctomycetota bacterium]
MLFNTLDFAVFLIVSLSVFYALPRRLRNPFLLVASYAFYGFWNWRFCGLLLLSTVVDYWAALRMETCEDQRRRKHYLWISLGVNLSILGFFKYCNFFIDSFTAVLDSIGIDAPDYVLRIALPVGISFYTFQTLSYTIDVYRREMVPTRKFLDFALFVALFPQLVAGPIERAKRILPQIVERRHASWKDVQSGSWLIYWGWFKKVYVSDNVARIVDTVYGAGAEPTGPEVLLALWAFAVQIYCDFSGYSDMARGVARLFGYNLMLNFNLPYFATNPQQVWRRWHISLSTWLRDYVYIPLGGNSGGRWKQNRNLFLTMLWAGLWHGASWTYVVFGAYHGALLAIHRELKPALKKIDPVSTVARSAWWLFRVGCFFHLWLLGLLLFRAVSFEQAASLGYILFTNTDPGFVYDWIPPFLMFSAPLLIVQIWQGATRDLEVPLRWPMPIRALLFAAMFLAIVFLGEDHGEPFIYFQF